MLDFVNANGLVDGCIPKGKACPLMNECNMFLEPNRERIGCPTNNVPRSVDYSCATARAFSLLACREQEKDNDC